MLQHQLTRCEPGYVFNCKSNPNDKSSSLLIVNHTPGIPLTTAILATYHPVSQVDLLPFLNSARSSSINPMILPTALADLVVSSEAILYVSIDLKLRRLEQVDRTVMDPLRKIDNVEREVVALNVAQYMIGRTERRLQRLNYMLGASLEYMQDTHHNTSTAAIPSPQCDVDAARRILRARNANMRSDVEHLLLQNRNNTVRVQTLQQVVRLRSILFILAMKIS
jgi:hypothetical protein